MRSGALADLLAAVAFFTRIPVPGGHAASIVPGSRPARFAPLVGWLVGGCAALVFGLAAAVLPLIVAVTLAVVCATLVTGALHEDGLADFCDGFGAGGDASRVLAIMRDSHTGVFGVTAIASVLLAKVVTLVAIAALLAPGGLEPGIDAWTGHGRFVLVFGLVLATGHALSRLACISFMYDLVYARPEPEAKGRALSLVLRAPELALAAVFGLAPLAVLGWVSDQAVWIAVVPVWLVRAYLARMLKARIGGYTGDCLGAAQQLTELACHVSVCSVLYVGAG